MVLPVGLSYQPLVPRKMICMLVFLRAAAPFGELLADLFGQGAFDLREDVEGFVCEGDAASVRWPSLCRAWLLVKRASPSPAAIFYLFEDLQRLIAMIDRFVELAEIEVGFAQSA